MRIHILLFILCHLQPSYIHIVSVWVTMSVQKERKKVAYLLEKEAEVQKLWEKEKAFEANASDT